MKPTCSGASLLRVRPCQTPNGKPTRLSISAVGRKMLLGALLLLGNPLAAQRPAYFADGYHGGIYGHYPVRWKTRFICDQLEAHPEWRIGLEIEPETWDTVAVRTPRDYARFKRLATDPRVEFTNPTYAQPYCYNITGESLIRQFDYGMRKIRSHFPDVKFTTYAVEEPCFTSCLPQILRLFGFRYASLKCPNTCWGGYMAPFGGETVNWIAPDGSSIRTVPRYACEALERGSVWQTTAWGNSTEYLEACARQGIARPIGMCYQDAGWRNGPWIGSGDSIRNHSTYVTWREYFERIAPDSQPEDYRMSQEDVRVSLMWGSQVLQRIAREVRHAENSIVGAEKLCALAALASGAGCDRAAIDEAWRTLMLAQHHDSWIVPYNGLHGRGTWADHIRRWTAATDSISDGLAAGAMRSIAPARERGRWRVRLVNTLGEARREVVAVALPEEFPCKGIIVKDARGRKVESTLLRTAEGGRELLFEAEVPPFGHTTYTLAKGRTKVEQTATAAATVEPLVVENDLYRLKIDPVRGGVITSLVARRLGNRELVDAASSYALGELRGCFYDERRFRSSTEHPAEVVLLCDNDLVKRIRIRGTIASHPFTQTITLRRGDPKIDFDLRIDWRHNVGIGAFAQQNVFARNRRACYDGRYKLNVWFPTTLAAPRLWKDAPFDVCESRQENTYFSTWDQIKHDIVLHWVDLAETEGAGLALLTDHTTSYTWSADTPLGLIVQYSGAGLWGRDYPIDGPTHLRFALVAHAGRWDEGRVQEENLRWNEPLYAAVGRTFADDEASWLDLAGSGYAVSAAYPEGEGLVLRLYNAAGDDAPRTIRFGTRFSRVEAVDLRGEPLESPAVRTRDNGTEVEFSIPRFGVKTLRLIQ